MKKKVGKALTSVAQDSHCATLGTINGSVWQRKDFHAVHDILQ